MPTVNADCCLPDSFSSSPIDSILSLFFFLVQFYFPKYFLSSLATFSLKLFLDDLPTVMFFWSTHLPNMATPHPRQMLSDYSFHIFYYIFFYISIKQMLPSFFYSGRQLNSYNLLMNPILLYFSSFFFNFTFRSIFFLLWLLFSLKLFLDDLPTVITFFVFLFINFKIPISTFFFIFFFLSLFSFLSLIFFSCILLSFEVFLSFVLTPPHLFNFSFSKIFPSDISSYFHLFLLLVISFKILSIYLSIFYLSWSLHICMSLLVTSYLSIYLSISLLFFHIFSQGSFLGRGGFFFFFLQHYFLSNVSFWQARESAFKYLLSNKYLLGQKTIASPVLKSKQIGPRR
ncbi:unnamed protein product [Acanthosepion pharaonis]|uniref:Uncharacterized protein n=1 Tax=Acanthosepion pharaonis TaxID=158019 RepID=A0A812E7E5_ACAPH|nr:unnamed protein product [Sepia pharaonis]